jgi:hypothetical protein
MILPQRSHLTFVLLCVGIAGCTPANFIQRVRPAPPCEVRVCTVVGYGEPRCDCRTHGQVQRQLREMWGRQLD